MIVATIGVGSNSVRMLIARIDGGTLASILRDRAGTRLFAGLDENGNMDVNAMELTALAVAEQVMSARAQNAREITVFATSAVRDAKNQQVFCDLIKKRTGIELEVLSGETEAALSFLGAAEESGYAGVIDIGGGSTEVVIGTAEKFAYAFSHQLGAVRLFNMHKLDRVSDIEEVIRLGEKILAAGPVLTPDTPDRWIGVGGTFTTLAAMVHKIVWTDSACVHGLKITYDQALDTARLLAPMKKEERVGVIGMRPQRADIVVHGICILLSCMRLWGIGEIIVSENGNLNGFLLNRYAHMFTENSYK